MSIVALIPARAGSKRIVGKNTRDLAGHPLIAYAIAAAQQSGVFDVVYVCSDESGVMPIVADSGAVYWSREPSADDEPDIEWVQLVVRGLGGVDAFAILRPTSPFRTAATIKRAIEQWTIYNPGWDSLRAVEPCSQHPGKMWALVGKTMMPLLLQPNGTPWHSSPTQTLPRVYVQNASLEIAWTETVRATGTIAGTRVMAFETEGWEGFDINTERDWLWAEHLVATGQAIPPEVN